MSRLRIYLTFELLLGVFMGEGEGRKEQVRKRALAHLAEQVPDETLRASLTPDYEVGCKRLLLSDDYYPSLSKPNERTAGFVGVSPEAQPHGDRRI